MGNLETPQTGRKDDEMSDDIVKRLRNSPWCQPMKREAAARIEALEAALAKADALAEAVRLGNNEIDPNIYAATAAYREARKATT